VHGVARPQLAYLVASVLPIRRFEGMFSESCVRRTWESQ